MREKHSSRQNNPRQIGGLIEEILASYGLAKNYYGWQIVSDWPEIVGESLAKISKAERFDDGLLIVSVESDSWRQEMSLQKDAIMSNIHGRRKGNIVKQIQFVKRTKGL